jgi:hypothetical protein
LKPDFPIDDLIRPIPNRVEKFQTQAFILFRLGKQIAPAVLAPVAACEIRAKGLCRRPPLDFSSFRAENF